MANTNQSVIRLPAGVDPTIGRTLQDLSDRINFLLDTLSNGAGAHTIVVPKLTVNGQNGFITWNGNGVVTSFKDPT